MAKTRHIQKRMSQRSIRQEVLDLVLSLGFETGDKTILNRKGLSLLLEELERVKKVVVKAHERGGFVVVAADGQLITTYGLDSYKRRRGKRRVF